MVQDILKDYKSVASYWETADESMKCCCSMCGKFISKSKRFKRTVKSVTEPNAVISSVLYDKFIFGHCDSCNANSKIGYIESDSFVYIPKETETGLMFYGTYVRGDMNYHFGEIHLLSQEEADETYFNSSVLNNLVENNH